MTLLHHPDAIADEYDELALAEAEAAAAEAEAAAARARAEVARARARANRQRAAATTSDDSTVTTSDDSTVTTPADSTVTAPGETASASGEPTADKTTADKPRGKTGNTATPTGKKRKDAPKPEHAIATTADDTVGDSTDRPGRLRRLATRTTAVIRDRRRPSRRAVAIAVMAVVSVAALAFTGYANWNHHEATAEQTRAQEFSDAAALGVTAITSLDFTHAQRDVQRVLDRSTGEFYTDFKNRSKDFASVIEKSQVTTKGKVTGTAVESLSGDTAVILVSATSDVTNAAGAQQEPRMWRLRVTVQDVNGTKKISKVDFVP
ncbi:hypothetical protein QSJ18_05615 [Gordonia sp. ABSL1-1]|uniref:hypothetical protein n=1 Tax=Gordonia sp. ABSL1-1 TaxID=3053923 RepID=UPI002572A784|nr:hypothetical protein [Gordonia sp. ABSL1-1]MDL9936213.1 hypothetical protein [Gordonia sp. ABSL1-1]